MTRPSQERKKIFSHKVRSGCDSCKRRHVKCPEERPACARCVKAGFECVYNVPKARLFEIHHSPHADELVQLPSSLYNRTHDDGFTFLNPAPGSAFGTPAERRALEYWLHTTGPWLARYVPKTHGAFWIEILPRCAHLLPATRHLLIAVAMVDERHHGLQPLELVSRARTIMEHYNKAIKILTDPKVEALDLYVAPLMAWIIEIMVNNPATAIMHINASRKMLEAVPPKPHNSTETQDIICDFVRDSSQFCSGFTATSATCAGIMSKDPSSIFQILNVRQVVTECTSEEVRAAIYKYASNLDKEGLTKFASIEALNYLRHWETVTLVRRYTGHENYDTLVATHFLVATATTLLAVQDDRSGNSFYRQKEAFDYILIKLEDCLNVEGLDSADRQGLEDAVAFALSLIARYSKATKHRKRAVELMSRTYPSAATGLYWMSWVGKDSSEDNASSYCGSSDESWTGTTTASSFSPGFTFGQGTTGY